MTRCILFFFALIAFLQRPCAQQVYKTEAFSLLINDKGGVLSLKDRVSGGEYAPGPDETGTLLQVVIKGTAFKPMRATFSKNGITLFYPGGETARVKPVVGDGYLRFGLTDISEDVEAVIWGPFNTVIKDTIGGAVGVVRTASFAIGIQGLNKKTSGGELVNAEGAVFDRGTTAVARPFGSSLQAFTVNRSKDRKIKVWDRWPDVPVKGIAEGELKGSAIALFGCKPENVLSFIETITLQEGIPYAKWKNDWIRRSPAPGRPYMITTFSESNIDTFLNYASRMGMAGVYHEDPFDTWGHFVLKKSLFPHGRAGFKACVDKAHAMGLRLGFHVLSNFITTNDAYVTPKPDPGLAIAGTDSLVGDISADATEITVGSPLYFQMRSDLNSVRLGDEIVRYMDVSKTPPYQLTGCIRGAFGTQKTAHKAGEPVGRLLDHPYKVFFPGWQLQKELATNIARFINETGADQMDFDGHEGTYSTGMGDLSLNTFAEDVFRQADHPVIFGSSRANHYFWHIDSYLNWGEPWYGGFRESQSDQRLANQPFYEENYLPNMLGWFLITPQTTPDDMDWMLARAAGFNAGYALVVREDALANPKMAEIIDRIKIWTAAQDRGLFGKEQRAWLKDPGNDVSLTVAGDNYYMQRFQKFAFSYEAKVLQPGQPTLAEWSFENKQEKQVPRIILTTSGEKGTVTNPVIEIDNSYHLNIPVGLAAGQSIVISGGTDASLYDQKGKFIRMIPLVNGLPELTTGSHLISFDAVMDASAPMTAKITLMLLKNREALRASDSATVRSESSTRSSISPEHLRCEYLTDPKGMDEPLPRLSWTLAATDPQAFGERQTAYRIEVGYSVKDLDDNQGSAWNSGWVDADDMQQIVYGGKQLESDRNYFWRVCVKDESGMVSMWSPIAHWSTGLFKRAEWSAQWIGSGESIDPALVDCNVADPWFRKVIDLKTQPLKATMFIASVGYHELYVNGKKIGNDVLSPCVSDHLKRARYVAYDIAGALRPGKNVVAIWLGASWSVYSSYATDDKPRAPIVIAQADVYDAAGPGQSPVLRIQTDNSWKIHSSPNMLLGKWEFGQMGGEIWDANKEIPDWNLLTCDEGNWKAPTVYLPRLMLTAQMVEPNHLFHELHPVSIAAQRDGTFRVDMGVNFAGWTEIKLKGQPGQRVDMLFSEREKDEMTFHLHNAFILGKSGEGTFKNHFNYSSGRWITIRGLKEKPKLTDIRGWVVRTAYDSAATFECSDSLQNWIYNKVLWNYENLSIGGYVVDCPQRERLGYGGDAHSTSESGILNYRLGAFYTKWMEDWRDVQGTRSMDPLNYGGNADDGILPHTAPTQQGGGGPGWGGICVTLPWLVYQQEGDRRILEKNFDMIKGWLAFLDTHTQNDLLVHFGGGWDFLGDWLWPHAGAEGMNNDKPQNICFNNCYRVYNIRTAAKIARVLGKNEQALRWEQQAAASSLAIQAKYYNPSDHSYSDSSMGNLAAALLAEIPPPDIREAVMDRLAREILVVRAGHIHVGITAGAMLFKLLRNAGRDDLLYSMTSQTDYPGWGYMKANGATSLWEMWEKDLPGHSLLHSSYLYPGAWYIDGVGGIRRDPDHPGFRRFVVRPPLLKASQLSWAKTSYDSPAGMIRTNWSRSGGALRLELTVPPGTVAKVCFPSAGPDGITVSSPWARYTGSENGYSVYELPAGKYSISGKEK